MALRTASTLPRHQQKKSALHRGPQWLETVVGARRKKSECLSRVVCPSAAGSGLARQAPFNQIDSPKTTPRLLLHLVNPLRTRGVLWDTTSFAFPLILLPDARMWHVKPWWLFHAHLQHLSNRRLTCPVYRCPNKLSTVIARLAAAIDRPLSAFGKRCSILSLLPHARKPYRNGFERALAWRLEYTFDYALTFTFGIYGIVYVSTTFTDFFRHFFSARYTRTSHSSQPKRI